MKVKELIKYLEKISNRELEVKIASASNSAPKAIKYVITRLSFCATNNANDCVEAYVELHVEN